MKPGAYSRRQKRADRLKGYRTIEFHSGNHHREAKATQLSPKVTRARRALSNEVASERITTANLFNNIKESTSKTDTHGDSELCFALAINEDMLDRISSVS